jgi:hypothetical protein
MEDLIHSPFIVPLGAFAMVAIIVTVVVWSKARMKEMEIDRDLRLQQMEHERRMKELEIEKMKVERAPEA